MKEKMSREEQLREEQEDLFFKMMFSAFDKTDAPKYEALNEQLKNDPSNQESEEETQAMLDFIEREIRKRDNELKKQEKHGRHVMSTLSRILLVAILIMLLGGTAYGSIPSFRVAAQNILHQVYKDATWIAITDSTKRYDRDEVVEGNNIVLMGYKFPGLPEDFVLEGKWCGKSRAWARYTDGAGKTVKFQIYRGSERDTALDTEDAFAEDVIIHGYKGVLSSEGSDITVAWYDEENKAYIQVEAKGFDEEYVGNLASKIEMIGIE